MKIYVLKYKEEGFFKKENRVGKVESSNTSMNCVDWKT